MIAPVLKLEPVLHGRRVMIVEDDLMVAMLIEDLLSEQGCHIIGPFGTVPAALAAAGQASLDLAVLDVNLRGQRVYPVAELLHTRGVPFLLVTGYGEGGVPDGHPDWSVVTKPFKSDHLMQALASRMQDALASATRA